jgi:hypothetical protein
MYYYIGGVVGCANNEGLRLFIWLIPARTADIRMVLVAGTTYVNTTVY